MDSRAVFTRNTAKPVCLERLRCPNAGSSFDPETEHHFLALHLTRPWDLREIPLGMGLMLMDPFRDGFRSELAFDIG